MCSCSISLTLTSPKDTARLALALAPQLNAGDVILLEGSIGAGKSFFARALILSLLTTPEDIPSPTFTLVQTYDAPKFDIWHCDLYRLTTPYEVQELGLEDAFESALCLVEWPDRLGDLTPADALVISLQITDTPQERHVILCATDPRWTPVLEGLNV
ncbi:MAG: tRNA (adenosine(37)-N6)-threonylcarbamoyltransferase complex ATPase subunit type 1 TsaE [Marinosulfonomonas sp.]|nr:tRNA (adenosine(37)-N6)-threonylcarbamoyltransferase complex ATPase subunit type 1 TsaE [Marinosulfonomonas sp.]